MVRIFDAHWPLVVALVNGEVTDADIDHMMSEYRRLHERDARFFLAQETRGVKLPSAAMRAKLAGINDHFAAEIEAHVITVAVVVPNKAYAGALRAIFWLSRERTKIIPVASGAELHFRAQEACAAEGLPLPPSAERFCAELDEAWARDRGFDRYFG